MAIDNLLRLGATLALVQGRFEKEGLPFSSVATMTSDGGILIEARFLLADVSYPIAWDHDTEFVDVEKLVKDMLLFVHDERETSDILDENVAKLRAHLEALREQEPGLDEYQKDLDAARQEFEQFMAGEVGSGYTQ